MSAQDFVQVLNVGPTLYLSLTLLPKQTTILNVHSGLVSLQKSSHPKLFPGDIVEYRRNKYFSHFGVYYGDRDGVPYVAHLTCRGTNSPLKINFQKKTKKKHTGNHRFQDRLCCSEQIQMPSCHSLAER